MIGESWKGLATLGVLLLSACGSAPEAPPNMPPPLSFAEVQGTPGVPRSDMINVAGAAVVASGQVGRDKTLIAIPYSYKYTAVLTEDVNGYSITVPGVQAPKGSPGFYVGTFRNPSGSRGPDDMWCFLPKLAGGSRDTICLFRMQPGIAAIAPTSRNPYMWFSFAPATGSFDFVHTPIFERREIAIPGDLKLEYRFIGWSDREVELAEYAVGREVHRFRIAREAGGDAVLPTVAGKLRISPAGADGRDATVKLE